MMQQKSQKTVDFINRLENESCLYRHLTSAVPIPALSNLNMNSSAVKNITCISFPN